MNEAKNSSKVFCVVELKFGFPLNSDTICKIVSHKFFCQAIKLGIFELTYFNFQLH